MEVMRLSRTQRAVRWLIIGIGLAYTVLPILWILSISVRQVGAVVFPVPWCPRA